MARVSTPTLIAWDTTSARVTVATLVKGKVTSFTQDRQVTSHFFDLLYTQALKLKGGLAGVDAIVVCVGPGSFTGLRVGVTAAKVLAYTLKKPVIEFTVFDILARQLQYAERVVMVLDAGRQSVYTAPAAGQRCLQAPRLETVGDLKARLKRGSALVGSGAERYFKDWKSARILKAAPPKARTMLGLAQARWARKQFSDAFNLVPVYLYPKECNVMLKKKG